MDDYNFLKPVESNAHAFMFEERILWPNMNMLCKNMCMSILQKHIMLANVMHLYTTNLIRELVVGNQFI
jgi:hypothetical protein